MNLILFTISDYLQVHQICGQGKSRYSDESNQKREAILVQERDFWGTPICIHYDVSLPPAAFESQTLFERSESSQSVVTTGSVSTTFAPHQSTKFGSFDVNAATKNAVRIGIYFFQSSLSLLLSTIVTTTTLFQKLSSPQ